MLISRTKCLSQSQMIFVANYFSAHSSSQYYQMVIYKRLYIIVFICPHTLFSKAKHLKPHQYPQHLIWECAEITFELNSMPHTFTTDGILMDLYIGIEMGQVPSQAWTQP